MPFFDYFSWLDNVASPFSNEHGSWGPQTSDLPIESGDVTTSLKRLKTYGLL